MTPFTPTRIKLCATLIAASAAVAVGTGQEPPPLFTTASAATAAAPADVRPTVKRARTATVAIASFDAVPAAAPGGPRAIQLNLFSDTSFIAEVRRVANTNPTETARQWVGALRQQPDSSVVLSERGPNIAANIRSADGRMFQIRPTGTAGAHVVEELNPPSLPRDGPARIPPPQPQPPAGAAADVAPCKDDGVLDVMVAYTPAALKKAGGLAAINGLIDLAEIETNQGYELSQITQRIRIVHRVEVSYTESAGYDAALDALTGTSDGAMDVVHSLRGQHRADLVSLWIDNNQYCGLAWQMPSGAGSGFADKAFSTVNVECATGYYSFGHEMGHNVGASHDRDNASGPPTFPYGYCLQHGQTPLFRTIMAYQCNGVDCPRINRWSNPAVTYMGVPTGVAQGSPNAADNHLVLEQTRSIAARWRCAKS